MRAATDVDFDGDGRIKTARRSATLKMLKGTGDLNIAVVAFL